MSLIDIKNLSFAYDGSAEKVFDNVSFQIDTGWRLGFTGRNGRGKTTFLKLLMGELEYTGSISASVSFDYFPIALHDTARPAAEALAEVVSDGEEWRLRREMAMLGLDEALLDLELDDVLLCHSPSFRISRHKAGSRTLLALSLATMGSAPSSAFPSA